MLQHFQISNTALSLVADFNMIVVIVDRCKFLIVVMFGLEMLLSYWS